MAKRIRLIATGGTISSVRRAGSTEVTPTLTAGELLASVGLDGSDLEVEIDDFEPVPSPAMTPALMLDVAHAARRARDDGCDGVVVTHGTGTIEETAYLLALTLPRTSPIALTGAMRNPEIPGSDAPANILGAFAVATTESTAALGPVVVMSDEIHVAQWVTKEHSTRVSPFCSAGAGPVGEIVEGTAHVWFHPTYTDHLGLPAPGSLPPVQLVKAVSGADDSLLRAALACAPAGIVIEGIGAGTVPPGMLPGIDAAIATGVPVVFTTRSPGGRNFERTYAMPGGEIDLARRGVVFAGPLSGPKACLRLAVGLALELDPREVFPAAR